MVPELPTTPDGIRRLLGSGFVDKIGPTLAQRIDAALGQALETRFDLVVADLVLKDGAVIEFMKFGKEEDLPWR